MSIQSSSSTSRSSYSFPFFLSDAGYCIPHFSRSCGNLSCGVFRRMASWCLLATTLQDRWRNEEHTPHLFFLLVSCAPPPPSSWCGSDLLWSGPAGAATAQYHAAALMRQRVTHCGRGKWWYSSCRTRDILQYFRIYPDFVKLEKRKRNVSRTINLSFGFRYAITGIYRYLSRELLNMMWILIARIIWNLYGCYLLFE